MAIKSNCMFTTKSIPVLLLFIIIALYICVLQYTHVDHINNYNYAALVLGQLVDLLSDCVCPGHELRLQCTVVGPGFTIWKGSAFICLFDEIQLCHSLFESGDATGGCNNGTFIARGINKTSGSDGDKFISQLTIQLGVNDSLDGRTVECIHDNLTQRITINTYTIHYTRGKYERRIRNKAAICV